MRTPVANTAAMSHDAASSVIAQGASELAALMHGIDPDSAEEVEPAFDPDKPMSAKQRAKELERISGRIEELLGTYEEEEDDGDAGSPDDVARLKEGIMTIAGTLRKKSMMRMAFLQSAAQQLAKSKKDHEGEDYAGSSDDDEEEGEGNARGGSSNPLAGRAIEDLRRDEGLKKQRLAALHQQAVGTLQLVAGEATKRERAATEEQRGTIERLQASRVEPCPALTTPVPFLSPRRPPSRPPSRPPVAPTV